MTLKRIRRFWTAMFFVGSFIVMGCGGEDPDPCDPNCPPTNCGETEAECG